MSTEVDTVNAYGHFVLIHSVYFHIQIFICLPCFMLKSYRFFDLPKLVFQIRNRNRTTLELQRFLKQMNQSISGQKVLEPQREFTSDESQTHLDIVMKLQYAVINLST